MTQNTSATSWRLGFFLVAAITTVATAAQFTRRTDCIQEPDIPNSLRMAGHRDTAFIMGGMGKYGSLPGIRKCLALAETLGRIGGWQGNVYIITDTQLDNETLARLHKGNPRASIRLIDPIRDGVDFRKYNAGGGGGYLKTLMFDLPGVPEDILIWHDCDKVIAQPNCIADMFQNAALDFGPDRALLLGALPRGKQDCPACRKVPTCTNTSWGQFAGRCGDGVHVGVFAAHRHWSHTLMEAWKKRQQAEPGVYDRYTLWDAMVEENLLANVSVLPKPFMDHMWNKGDVGCINHISGPRAWDRKNEGALVPLLKEVCLQSCTDNEILEVYTNCLKWVHGKVVLDPRMPEALKLAKDRDALECTSKSS